MDAESGRFVLRLKPELHARLKRRAHDDGRSLNTLCADLLAHGVARTTPVWRRRIMAVLPLLRKKFGESLWAVAVFGSQTSGEMHATSDIDVLIVLHSRSALTRALYRWWDDRLSPMIGGDFSPHFAHLPESPEQAGGLWLEIAVNHELIYDRAGRLAVTVAGLRTLIGSGGARREWAYGQPYWVKDSPEGRA